MTDQLPPNVDTGSLIVSYLWQNRGAALRHELRFALRRNDVEEALQRLVAAGYVDLVMDELPAVRLTREAIGALEQHVSSGAALPERLERARDRDARIAAQAAMAQSDMADMLREVRDQNAALRKQQQLMLEGMRQAGILPGMAPTPPQLPGGGT